MTTQDAAAWRLETAAVNLARQRTTTTIAAGLALLIGVVILFVPEWRGNGFATKAFIDAAAYAGLFVLVTWAQRQPADSPWRMRVAWLTAMVVLFNMTGWYFHELRVSGPNSDYLVGVVLVGLMMLVPPRSIAAALAVNHTIFCIGLIGWSGQSRAFVVSDIANGTVVVVMAGITSWLVYSARQAEFMRTRELAAANAELREVMAIAAHELRSPLLGVRDVLAFARRDAAVEDASPLARTLDVASTSCGEMAGLVTRLIDAHAMEESRGSLTLAPHDLRDACASVGERLEARAHSKGQRLALALPESPALARIDATAFVQIMENLVGNALKFSPPGSAIECAVFAQGDRWCVEVRDEGPAIPEQERGRLFQKFHRGSARPTGGEASSGLGLFIVRRLTEAMGGRVSHIARAERGTIFRVELPAI